MDSVTNDDIRAVRGLEILEGKVSQHAQRSSSEGRDRHASLPRKTPAGLEMGRRSVVVVVKPGTQGAKNSPRPASVSQPSPSTSKSGALNHHQAVKVIDHGVTQKEAVRRLFDAQVLIQSYEQQLQEKEARLDKLQGDLHTATLAAKDPGRHVHSTFIPAVSFGAGVAGNLKSTEKKDKTQKSKGEGEAVKAEKPKVPQWLRNDEQSRIAIENLRTSLLKQYADDGRLDQHVVLDHFWRCGLAFAERWSGSPSDDISKQNEQLQEKLRNIHKQSLQETSMLRQHIKKLEKKYKDLHSSAKQLERNARRGGGLDGMSPAGRHTALASSVGSPAASPSSESRPVRAAPSAKGGALAGQGRRGPTNPAASPAAASSSDSRPARGAPAARGGAATGANAGPATGPTTGPAAGPAAGPATGPATGATAGGATGGDTSLAGGAAAGSAKGGVQASRSVPELGATASGRASPTTLAPTSPVGLGSFSPQATLNPEQFLLASLAEDDTLPVEVTQEELDTMDHEIFEPLNTFDGDMREIMIDTVNEKVRRILTLNASKFKNGKLPFGLKSMPGEGVAGENNIDNLLDELDRMRAELEETRAERDRALRMLEAMRGGKHSGTDEQMANTTSSFRGEFSSPEKPQMRFPGNEGVSPLPTPTSKDNSGDIASAVAQATQLLKDKIKALEKEIWDLKHRKGEPQPQSPSRSEQPRIVVTTPKADSSQPASPTAIQKEDTPGMKPIAEGPGAEQLKMASSALVKANQVAKKSQELFRKVLTKVSIITALKPTKKGQRAVESLIGSEKKPVMSPKAQLDSSATLESILASSKEDPYAQALPAFEEWANESLRNLDVFARSATGRPAPKQETNGVEEEEEEEEEEEIDPGEEIVSARSPVVKPEVRQERVEAVQVDAGTGGTQPQPQPVMDDSELLTLRTRCKEQEDEIARLLLMIDELRARLDKMEPASIQVGARPAITKVLEEVGLKDIVEAGSGPRLKGVFERLYEDAVDRINRLGIVQEHMVMANKTYNAVMAAISNKDPTAGAGQIPDLQRLNATTSAAVRGMWYHTEHLFRRTCAYAISQGAEASVLKSGRGGVSDMVDYVAAQEGNMYAFDDDGLGKLSRRGDRVPGRRGGERSRGQGLTQMGNGSLFRKTKGQMVEQEPMSFASYLGALREARAEFTQEEWPRATKRRESLSNKLGGLVGSQSLPALPKGRTFFQARDGDDSMSTTACTTKVSGFIEARQM